MRTGTTEQREILDSKPSQGGPRNIRPAFLHLVTQGEMLELGDTLARGELPLDLQLKLNRLAHGNVIHQYLAQHCRTVARLLEEIYAGRYQGLDAHTTEHLLRVLAYLRKDDDAIPDYRSGGYDDDLQELRRALTQHESALDPFKKWHLCTRVPHLWAEQRRVSPPARASRL